MLVPSCYECERLQAGLLGGPLPGVSRVARYEVVEAPGFASRDSVGGVPGSSWPR